MYYAKETSSSWPVSLFFHLNLSAGVIAKSTSEILYVFLLYAVLTVIPTNSYLIFSSVLSFLIASSAVSFQRTQDDVPTDTKIPSSKRFKDVSKPGHIEILCWVRSIAQSGLKNFLPIWFRFSNSSYVLKNCL